MPTGVYLHKPHQGFQKGSNKTQTAEQLRKLSLVRTGRFVSLETRKKLSESHSGEKSALWKGGISTHERKVWLNGRRRAMKNEAVGSHAEQEWQELKAKYNWTCPRCLRKEPEIKLTEDHIIPLIKGGSDKIENIQPLCGSCNSSKSTKIIKYG